MWGQKITRIMILVGEKLINDDVINNSIGLSNIVFFSLVEMEKFGVDAETCKEFINIQSQSGDNINEKMTSSLKEWEKTRVNIAVIGETYVGKSTHINSHFGNYAARAGQLMGLF